MENPWDIQSIYELQYFHCPSCVFKVHSKQEFIYHSCEFHPESIDYLSKIIDNSLSDVTCPWSEISMKIKQEEPNEESIFVEPLVEINELENEQFDNDFIENQIEESKFNTNIEECQESMNMDLNWSRWTGHPTQISIFHNFKIYIS